MAFFIQKTMKITLRILLAALLIFFGIKLLVPYYAYPIEHFEYQLLHILPISWKVVAVLSRILIGLMFVAAFLLLFYYPKIKWIKYVSLATLSIPFIVNTVYPEQLTDKAAPISEALSFPLSFETNEPLLLAYLSYNCHHCKEAAIKLKHAQIINSKFPKVIAVTYNNKLDSFFIEKQIDFPIEMITPEDFIEITESSFPKFQLIKNNKIIGKWDPYELNYAVMDKLSNQKF